MGRRLELTRHAIRCLSGCAAVSITAINKDASFAVRQVSAYDPACIRAGAPTYSSATLVSGLPTTYNNSSGNWRLDNVGVGAVPESSTLALFTLGLSGLGFIAQRRRRGCPNARPVGGSRVADRDDPRLADPGFSRMSAAPQASSNGRSPAVRSPKRLAAVDPSATFARSKSLPRGGRSSLTHNRRDP